MAVSDTRGASAGPVVRARERGPSTSQLLEAVDQPMIAVDLARVITYWNRAAEEAFGWSAAEAVGRRSTDVISRDESLEQAKSILDVLRSGESWSGDYDITRRDGSRISCYVTNKPVIDENGGLVAVIAVAIDTTEERAGQRARRRLDTIVDVSGDAICSTNLDGIVTSWNRAAEELFGYSAAEAIGQDVSFIGPPESAAMHAELRALVVAGGSLERIEAKGRCKDGTILEILITTSTARDETGLPIGLSVIAHDLTETRRAWRALEASERQLSDAQQTAHLGSFESDCTTRVLTWSAEYFRILGLDPLLTPTRALFMSRVHPDDVSIVADAWLDASGQGAAFDVVFRVFGTDSTVRWVRSRAVPECDADGHVVKVSGTMTDETDSIEADRLRRAAETRFEIGFELSAIGAAIVDLDGIPLRVNPALCRVLGRPEALLIGKRWAEYTHPDEVSLGQLALTSIAAGHDTYADERRYLRPDGTVVWTSTDVAVARDELGVPQYLFFQLQDITARKAALEDLRRSNAELEQFAYIASHDLSEPLRAISGPVSLLGRRYRGRLDDEADQFIDFAVDGCKRMQTLIDDLLAYSRVGRADSEAGPVDADVVMARVLDGLRVQIEGAGAVVEVDPLPTVWGDAVQLGQVLQNLVSNAIKFTTPDSVPMVTVSAERFGSEWQFTVSDAGIGVEPRHRERVFGMFKRLHGRDQFAGTGIGLAVVKKIVEQRGGRVGVDAGPDGRGSSFWFTIPTREVTTT